MLDIGGLDEGFPVIGEMPKCSDTLGPVVRKVDKSLSTG